MLKINLPVLLLLISVAFVFSSCNKEMFTEQSENSYDVCSVSVNSNPVGAQIYIDNKFSGYFTPCTIKNLSESLHKVTLKFNLIQDTSIVLQPVSSSVQSIYIDYFASPRNYGNIKCISIPAGAAIYMNKKDLSMVTPNSITYLFPGIYNVKMKYYGYRDDSLNVTVRGGQTSTISIALQDTSEWVDYRVNNSNIPSNKIVAAKKDNKNNVWAGTLDAGVVKFTNGRFSIYNTSNSGLPYNFTTSIEVDKNDNVWIGTISGLACFNGSTWKTYKAGTHGLPANYISSLYADVDGNVWAGTESGLAKITGEQVSVIQLPSGLGAYINSIISDKKGNLWVATDDGIGKLGNGTWTIYTRDKDRLDGYDAGYLAEDNEGNIWCSFFENLKSGIYGGIMKFDGSKWSEVSVPLIPKGQVQRIYMDSKGYIWIASANGFLVIKNGVQTVYHSTAYSMWSYDVRDIFVDAGDNAWIALYGGGILKWKKPYK